MWLEELAFTINPDPAGRMVGSLEKRVRRDIHPSVSRALTGLGNAR